MTRRAQPVPFYHELGCSPQLAGGFIYTTGIRRLLIGSVFLGVDVFLLQTLAISSSSIAYPQLRVSMAHFDMLPSDIMLEILSRVPTETVLECKLVSKPWRYIIQHPSFSQLHLNHLNHLDSTDNSGKFSFMFYTVEVEKRYHYTEYDENLNRRLIRKTRMNLRPLFKYYYIIGSCDGLICFNVSYAMDSPFEPGYICNPLTRESTLLPKSKSQGKRFVTGFGYSSLTHEYKVVRIHNSKGDPDFGIVQVYTLGSGIGWRNAETLMDYDVEYFSQCGAFVNGSIHWVDKKGTIFAFDLADEEFRVIPSPPCLVQDGNKPCIVKLEVVADFLCAIIKNVGGCWDMWFLKSKSHQDVIWSEKFSNFSHSMVRPLTFDKSGELLAYDCLNKSVYRYAPEVSSSRMLVKFSENIRFGTPHKNTLVSLKALGEENTKLMDSGEGARSSGETKSSYH